MSVISTSILKSDRDHHDATTTSLTSQAKPGLTGFRKSTGSANTSCGKKNRINSNTDKLKSLTQRRATIESATIDQLEDFVNIDDILSENEPDELDQDEQDEREINAILKNNDQENNEESDHDLEDELNLEDDNLEHEIFEAAEKNLQFNKKSKCLKKAVSSNNLAKNKNLKLKMISEIKRHQKISKKQVENTQQQQQTDDQKLIDSNNTDEANEEITTAENGRLGYD